MSLKKRYQGSSSFNYRKEMFLLPSPHLNKRYRYSVFPTNEELNNKIDLEIRILDGILKLLNAICNNTPAAIITPPDHAASSTTSSSSSSSNSLHSASLSSLADSFMTNFTSVNLSLFDEGKCSTTGAAIAASFMQQCNLVSSARSAATHHESTQSFDLIEMNQVFQILSACKCLFVSHRKIAIYLKNMQQAGPAKNKLPQRSATTTGADTRATSESPPPEALASNYLDLDVVDAASSSSPVVVVAAKSTNSANKPSLLSSSDDNHSSSGSSDESSSSPQNNNNSGGEETNVELGADEKSMSSTGGGEMPKVVLSNVRLPLSWKWNDHLKATKNSENVTAKFAAFALIYLGNMIYDTQLISNIDASITEISFNETFVFDDVKLNDFEITLEIYSYELFNTTHNILQSAKKLAKQLTDFATFKRYTSNHHHSSHQQHPVQLNQAQMLPSLVLSNGSSHSFSSSSSSSSSSHQYSMHKFKLIARGTLTHNDLNDSLQTKCLTLINEPGFENQPLNSLSHNSGTSTLHHHHSTTIGSIQTSAVNKLPLFDYYSCRLRLLPASTTNLE